MTTIRKPLAWRRDPLGGLYTAAEADGGEWLLERESTEGPRGGKSNRWLIRRDHRIVATTTHLSQAKQWVQVERVGGHR